MNHRRIDTDSIDRYYRSCFTPKISIHRLKILEVWPIVSIHWFKIFFLMTTIDLIDVFCRQLIIDIDPIDVFLTIGAQLCQQPACINSTMYSVIKKYCPNCCPYCPWQWWPRVFTGCILLATSTHTHTHPIHTQHPPLRLLTFFFVAGLCLLLILTVFWVCSTRHTHLFLFA